MTLNLSNCCSQPVLTSYGDEGTNCWICSRCKKMCDAHTVTRYAASTSPMAPSVYQDRWVAFSVGIVIGVVVGALLLAAIFVR